jgi:hypothetical protein
MAMLVYKFYLLSLWNDQKKISRDSLFFLFIKLVQINLIFSDNELLKVELNTKTLTLTLYTYCLFCNVKKFKITAKFSEHTRKKHSFKWCPLSRQNLQCNSFLRSLYIWIMYKTVYNKHLSSECNVTAHIEPVQHNMKYWIWVLFLNNLCCLKLTTKWMSTFLLPICKPSYTNKHKIFVVLMRFFSLSVYQMQNVRRK